jgi:arabinogalactan oligomer / maltooligosaccharide transport system permease protein
MTAVTADIVSPAPVGPRKNRFRRSLDKYWYAYALITPVLVVMALLVLWPLVRSVYFSFTNANAGNLGNPTHPVIAKRAASYSVVGLKNFTDILSGKQLLGLEGNFWAVTIRTIIWTAANVFFHYTIGLGLAMMLNRKLTGRGGYRILLMLPWAVPAYISAFAWKLLYNQEGAFNWALNKIGVDGGISWLNHPTWAFVAVIMVNIWLGVPFMMVALLGGLQSIPAEQYEAAEMDGANPWQRFVNVTLPGLRSVSSTVILLGTIWTFNMFPIIWLITQGGPFGKTEILITYAYKAFFQRNEYGVAAAYGLIILSMLLVFSTGYLRVLRSKGQEV